MWFGTVLTSSSEVHQWRDGLAPTTLTQCVTAEINSVENGHGVSNYAIIGGKKTNPFPNWLHQTRHIFQLWFPQKKILTCLGTCMHQKLNIQPGEMFGWRWLFWFLCSQHISKTGVQLISNSYQSCGSQSTKTSVWSCTGATETLCNSSHAHLFCFCRIFFL